MTQTDLYRFTHTMPYLPLEAMRARIQTPDRRFRGVIATLVALVASSATAAPMHDPNLGLPPIEISERDQRLVPLGRKLFFDERLSADGKVSCGSCHLPSRAFTDGRTRSIGHAGQLTTRNAPTLLNVAYLRSLFWDGRASSLESQARAPLMNPVEHALADDRALQTLVLQDSDYVAAFETLLGVDRDEIGTDHVSQALAAYERTLRAGGSSFDRYYYGGDKGALGAIAIRGFELFRGKAGCTQCHSIGPEAALFTDERFHVSPVGLNAEVTRHLAALTRKVLASHKRPADLERLIASDANIAALGRFVVTQDPRDIGAFVTPTLRNIALTAPYMHDGSIAALSHAIDLELYGRGKSVRYPIVLTTSEKAELIEFLKSLTSGQLDF